jgi:hypothetical protein
MFVVLIIFALLIAVFIFLAFADACSVGQRQQTRALIKAQRDLAIEKGEIKETAQKEIAQNSDWNWFPPEKEKTGPICVNLGTPPPLPIVQESPPKSSGEHVNFATQKWE